MRGRSVGATASCDEDVGEVGDCELEELVDRPGTTNVRRGAFRPSTISNELWFLTTIPMVIVPMIFAEFPCERELPVYFRCHE